MMIKVPAITLNSDTHQDPGFSIESLTIYAKPLIKGSEIGFLSDDNTIELVIKEAYEIMTKNVDIIKMEMSAFIMLAVLLAVDSMFGSSARILLQSKLEEGAVS